MQILVIAAGGAAGAVARFALSGLVYGAFGRGFPWGTLTVNVVGSALIGFLAVVLVTKTDSSLLRDALVVGFLGSLTTFSTFSLETIQLLQEGAVGRALLNVGISVVVCITACAIGILLARAVQGGAI